MTREYHELLAGGEPEAFDGFGFAIRTNNLKLSCSQRIVDIVGRAHARSAASPAIATTRNTAWPATCATPTAPR